jgi:hypothetical protein
VAYLLNLAHLRRDNLIKAMLFKTDDLVRYKKIYIKWQREVLLKAYKGKSSNASLMSISKVYYTFLKKHLADDEIIRYLEGVKEPVDLIEAMQSCIEDKVRKFQITVTVNLSASSLSEARGIVQERLKHLDSRIDKVIETGNIDKNREEA